MVLPDCLLQIIESYVDKFNFWESLPNPKRIHRIAQKSNEDLVTRLTLSPFLPPHLVRARTFTFAFQVNHETIRQIEAALCGSVESCWQTSALFWLFIENEETIYHGCFTKIFEESLFYQLVNVISTGSTESNFLYLIKNRCTSGAGLFLLH